MAKAIRTLLFVPGVRPDMMEKAKGLPADVIVLDMEDSVPPGEKETARRLIREALPAFVSQPQLVYARPNGAETGLLHDDLEAVVLPGLDGISLPKPSSPEAIREADELIGSLEEEQGIPRGTVKLIPWIESAYAVAHAYEFASASPRIVGVSFGHEDFTLDMGIERTLDGNNVFYAKSAIAVAARAAEVMAIDTPYPDFRDEEGLRREANLARQLGYRAKFCIHPAQLGPVDEVFRPTGMEVDYARRVVAAFEEAEARGHGAIALDGRMVDVPVVERARKLLAELEEEKE